MSHLHRKLVQNIVADLQALREDERSAIAEAYSARDGYHMVPFVGSGLNSMATGRFLDWAELVRQVMTTAGLSAAEQRAFSSSDLLFPEQLELLLRRCVADQPRLEKIVQAFDDAFSSSTIRPAALHERLVQSFPYLVTTNYNLILETADRDIAIRDHRPAKALLDVTDVEPSHDRHIHPTSRAIVHLHGVWARAKQGSPQGHGDDRKERAARITRGIGYGGPGGPCLILTDHQYHRMYYHNAMFRRRLELIFSPASFFLFLGSGMSASEFTLHHIFRENQLSGGIKNVGLYVNFGIDAARAELLRTRGLIPLSLPIEYGESPATREAILHAFLDALHEFTGSSGTVDTPEVHQLRPSTIIVAGVSSRQYTLGLDEMPQTERSRSLSRDCYVEEVAGQHMYPALALAQEGHRVALASLLGADDDGDWILRQARSTARRFPGELDTHMVLRGPQTRRTFVLTYARQGEDAHKFPVDGERQVFDLPETVDPHGNWLSSSPDLASTVRTHLGRLRDARSLRALYLGAYGPDLQELVLEEVGTHVDFLFFETGSTGGYDDVTRIRTERLAQRCNHVLSSAAFVFWLAGKRLSPTDRNHEVQARLADEPESALLEAHRRLFGEAIRGPREARFLVATLGSRGSIATDGTAVEYVNVGRRPRGLPLKPRCWLGCGDTFRWAYADSLLRVTGEIDLRVVRGAMQAAATVAARRVYRLQSLAYT